MVHLTKTMMLRRTVPLALAIAALPAAAEDTACSLPYTPVYQIQGSGLGAAITGTVTTQGVVVGDFEGSDGLSGFYLQDPAGDGDPATSDGIFVYTGAGNLVTAGQHVRVTGYARERFNQTVLNGSNSNNSAVPAANVVNCGVGTVTPVDVMLPFASTTDPESYEGMLVRLPQALVISEYFNYDRFGEMVLAMPLDGESRLVTPTAIESPGAGAAERAQANLLRRITLDDARSAQNPTSLRHPNGHPFSLDNRFRGGDIVQGATGVLGFDFNLYRVFPTAPAVHTATNLRADAPQRVGQLRIAGINALNYFLSPDYPTGNPADNRCGPLQNLECRGADADQPMEFTRQRSKFLAALAGLDADVIGLMEVENTAGVDPLADLATGLDDLLGAGTFASIDTGTIGTDAIKVGLLYRPAVVSPVGAYRLLDSSVDPRFRDSLNRPALAQAFEVNATGERVTVVVNHLKSKGSDCNAVGDPDLGDGQGNCNQTRTLAAQALVDWLATDPTGSADPDVLIIGDLNAYAKEDPLTATIAGPDDILGTADDYTNLVTRDLGEYAYSYVFDGQVGYLDHALASAKLQSQVKGIAIWQINGDEPDVLDYDTTFKPAEQEALYEPNGFRSSDHDPVLVDLTLAQRFGFGGFAPPVGSPPALNATRAGAAVPVTFSLDGDRGLDIFAPGYPRVVKLSSCGGSAAGEIEPAISAGDSSLTYDPLAADLYTYVWKTKKAWAGSCRRLELRFYDGGTEAYAEFDFR
jgi:hypothetical protein